MGGVRDVILRKVFSYVQILRKETRDIQL